MKNLFLLLGASLTISMSTPRQCIEADIVVIYDLSGSIKANEITIMAEAVNALTNSFFFSDDGVLMSHLPFNMGLVEELGVSMTYEKDLLYVDEEVLTEVISKGDATYINGILHMALDQFRLADSMRPEKSDNLQRIAIIISDGIFMDKYTNTSSYIYRLKNTFEDPPVKVICINTIKRPFYTDEYFMSMATDSSCYYKMTYKDIIKDIQNLSICQ